MAADQAKIDDYVSNITSEFMRGTLLLLILLVIEKKGTTHGYEIIQEILSKSKDLDLFSGDKKVNVGISSGIRLKEGTIYPHLNKLNNLGFLESHWDRNRRLYTLTPLGREMLYQIKNTYRYLGNVVTRFF
jgi:DNA-binding PadR family transcriptional regulator